MTASLPAGRQGRLAALLLLLAALAIFYVAVAAPMLNLYNERQSRIDSQRALLVKFTAVGGEIPVLRRRLTRLRAAMGRHRLTLAGTSEAVAAASLQGHIEQSATAAGLTVGSTEILPAQAQGQYRRIGLRLLVSGSYESLMRLLGDIETSTPPLVVDNLQIRSLQRRLNAAPAVNLDASLEVYGFRAADTAMAAKP